MSNLNARIKQLEKVANPRHVGCLVILNPDGSLPELPKWAAGCSVFVILPAKVGLDEKP